MKITGKDICNLFATYIKSKYSALNFTEEQLEYFYRGLLIGAEGMMQIIDNHNLEGTPTSYSTQCQIADIFMNGKTPNCAYYREKWKERKVSD